MKEGIYTVLMDAVIGTYTGYGQVHARGYWEERTPDNSFEATPELLTGIRNTRDILQAVPRLEGVAMAASATATHVTAVAGMDMQLEEATGKLNKRVIRGKYLAPGDRAVLLGNELAAYLHLGTGDTVVLLGQGYHGAGAAGKYLVKGLIRFGSPELSRQLVIMPLAAAQEFYGMEGRINNLVLHFENPGRAEGVLDFLRQKLGAGYEVMGWKETMPGIENMIRTDRAEGYVFMFILYMVVSFGMFGTILMMLAERKHEFGVLLSLGMQRRLLAMVVCLETALIAVSGAVAGMLGAWPVCYYFFRNPVALGGDLKKMTEEYGLEALLRASIDPSVFIRQATVVLLIALFLSCYPYIKLLRLQPTAAMRS